jgi:Ni,Fe-hydrogenase I cytochrome b subunit
MSAMRLHRWHWVLTALLLATLLFTGWFLFRNEPRRHPQAETLDFTFALHRSYRVEFLAKPTLLVTNIAKSKL